VDLLVTYRGRFSKVDFMLKEATSQANVAAVQYGRIDVAFIPGASAFEGCEVQSVWGEEILIAVPAAHPLATRTSISWDDLRDEVFLVPADLHGPELEGILRQRLLSVGSRPRISAQGVGREDLMNLVGKGFGFSLAAASSTSNHYVGVVFRPVANGEFIDTSIAWLKSNKNSLLKRLLEIAAAEGKKHQRRSLESPS
jgi:DNA-binding transcriptional LysR family regulator